VDACIQYFSCQWGNGCLVATLPDFYVDAFSSESNICCFDFELQDFQVILISLWREEILISLLSHSLSTCY